MWKIIAIAIAVLLVLFIWISIIVLLYSKVYPQIKLKEGQTDRTRGYVANDLLSPIIGSLAAAGIYFLGTYYLHQALWAIIIEMFFGAVAICFLIKEIIGLMTFKKRSILFQILFGISFIVFACMNLFSDIGEYKLYIFLVPCGLAVILLAWSIIEMVKGEATHFTAMYEVAWPTITCLSLDLILMGILIIILFPSHWEAAFAPFLGVASSPAILGIVGVFIDDAY